MKWSAKIQIFLGIWVFVSPWILGFKDIAPALWSSCISGLIVLMIGVISFFSEEDVSGQ
ncbi:MAG: hypothetical protein EXS49_00795 [Candidatus Pacebacteria bacterium]|nr:hypothetical protein [Candidatus Paceibacterota bacterium]